MIWADIEKLIMNSKPSYGLPEQLAESLCKHEKLANLFEYITKRLWLSKLKNKLIEMKYLDDQGGDTNGAN
jgi:hypothetical protein